MVKFDLTVRQGKERTDDVHCLTIRTVEPLTGSSLIRSLVAGRKGPEYTEGDRGYYKIQLSEAGTQSMLLLLPRTAVPWSADAERSSFASFAARPSTLKFLAEPMTGRKWNMISSRCSSTMQAVKSGTLPGKPRKESRGSQFDEFLELTSRWVMGLADVDDFLPQFIATCRDPGSAQTSPSWLRNLRDACLRDMHKPHKDEIPDHLRIQELVGQIMRFFRDFDDVAVARGRRVAVLSDHLCIDVRSKRNALPALPCPLRAGTSGQLRRRRFPSGGVHDRPQQHKAGPTIHLAFDGLQPVHVSFNWAIAPSLSDRGEHGGLVLANPCGKPADLRA